VSTKHANFIQADPGGSADDVFRLIADVRRRIWDDVGVALHCENLLIGFPEPLEPLSAALPGGHRGGGGDGEDAGAAGRGGDRP
jgi:hypothetical protein